MGLKEILVHLDVTPRSALRLDIAADLAVRESAHLVGVATSDIPSAELFRGNTMTLLPVSPEQMIARIRSESAAENAPLEAAFRTCLRVRGLTGEWRIAEGNPAATLPMHARYADVTIVGQPNRYEAHQASEDAMLASTLLLSGRPVLVIPFAGEFPSVGQRVLVAWNASREATRAVHDALPLLVRAQTVTVLAINPASDVGRHGDVPGGDIAAHLAHHGIKVEAAHTVTTDISEGAALLSYAADIGADLIVSGAYGHSRVREMVFGGVTRTLLNEMTVPVLLSH